jgi:CAP-Gly domain-containing linker protein 1
LEQEKIQLDQAKLDLSRLQEQGLSQVKSIEALESEIDALKESCAKSQEVLSQNEATHGLERQEYLGRIDELEKKLTSVGLTQSDQMTQMEQDFKTLKEASSSEMDKMKEAMEMAKNSQVGELEKEIDKLKKTIEELTSQLHQQAQSIAEKESTLQTCQTEFETFKNSKLAELDQLTNDSKLSTESSTTQNKLLTEKLHSLENQYDESKKSNTELQARLTELMQNSGDNSAQLIALNDKLKEKESLIETLQLSLTNSQTEENNLKQEKQSLDSKLSELAQTAQTKQSDLQANLLKKEELNADLTNQIKQLEQAREELNAQLSTERETALKANEQILSFKAKQTELETNLDETKTEIASLNQKLSENRESSESSQANLSEQNQKLTNEKEKLLESTESLNIQVNTLTLQLAEQQSQTKLEIEKVTELQEICEKQKTDLHKMTQDLDNEKLSKSKSVENDATAASKVTQELDEANLKIEQLENDSFKLHQDNENTIKHLNDLVQDYDAKLEAKSSEVEEVKIQYEEELDRLDNLNRALLEELEELKQNSRNGNNNTTLINEALTDEKSFKILTPGKIMATNIRAYCDICEEFDLHDTEDCPQQSMPQEAQLELEQHSKHNAVKAPPRPFCDLRDQFGHVEDDCPNSNEEDKIEEF